MLTKLILLFLFIIYLLVVYVWVVMVRHNGHSTTYFIKTAMKWPWYLFKWIVRTILAYSADFIIAILYIIGIDLTKNKTYLNISGR